MTPGSPVQPLRLAITGMSCAGCVAAVETALRGTPGVAEASVNFAERTAQVVGDAASRDPDRRPFGRPATMPPNCATPPPKPSATRRSRLIPAIGPQHRRRRRTGRAPDAGRNGGPAAGAGDDGRPDLLDRDRPADLGGDDLQRRPLLRRRLAAIPPSQRQHGYPDRAGHRRGLVYSMLVTLFPASVPSLARHAYFEAAVTIIALINLGSALESRARGKASAAIQRLLGLRPKTARWSRATKNEMCPSKPCGSAMLIRVRPGEKIPVDGDIVPAANPRGRIDADRRTAAGGQARRRSRHRRHGESVRHLRVPRRLGSGRTRCWPRSSPACGRPKTASRRSAGWPTGSPPCSCRRC
jgi:Cu+-exporting ATPase